MTDDSVADYQSFLADKALSVESSGFDIQAFCSDALMPFQRDIVRVAARVGKFCVWADCGMGKTLMQLEWAWQVAMETGGRVLILAPLAVSHQTIREAEKFGITGVAFHSREGETDARIVVTNYQKLAHFDPSQYVGVVLDESSIIKSMDGATRNAIMEAFAMTPYRLACSATPAPNDYMELGNHAEFVGAMSRVEMLAMFFTHDGGDTSKWRLKGHAQDRFWEWVCSWAITIRKPSDLGYADGDFILPDLRIHDRIVTSPMAQRSNEHGQFAMFDVDALTLGDQRAVQRASLGLRVEMAASLANSDQSQWLIWCHLNDESDALSAAIPGAVEVSGADSDEYKQLAAAWFTGDVCLCSERLFSDKLLAWQSVDDLIRSTCATTISEININGKNEPESSAIGITQRGGHSTSPMRLSAMRRNQPRRNGRSKIQNCDSLSDLGATDSLLTHIGNSSASTAGNVPSVEASRREKATIAQPGSTLIIDTQTESSGDCFATNAIWDSVSSKTTLKSSNQPRCICGHSSGRRVLVSKAAIFGWGMNFQNCHKVAFVGMSHSYESFYQAVRRCWRFGQKSPVDAYVIYDEAEGAVIQNLRRKEAESLEMADRMVEIMKTNTLEHLQRVHRSITVHTTRETTGDGWAAYLGDCVEGLRGVDADSIHYSIFSPPFASLYTYSNSDRDMGNCKDHETFAAHFAFLVAELHRVLMPGRLVSFHCMNLPMSKTRDGAIGVRDFRGELIRTFEQAGFIFHSEVCIWKDPVTAMQRTKAIGLLHKQIVKDSAMSRQGIPDYLVTMRKLGDNTEPVSGKLDTFCGEDAPVMGHDATRNSINIWQRYASPVWMDINPSDTLQFRSARENDDERHICPLQLDVIRRGVQLWSNPGDLVLSPFMGIGSEGHVALELGRRFVGFELKPSYYDVAVRNLAHAETIKGLAPMLPMESIA